MGGGDLNTKKSWHPSTMKNQERVWKAERAAAEESKRILELQRERAQERDRAELNDLAKQRSGTSSNNDRLDWMYDKPDKKGHQEDYLLGRAIEKNYDKPDKPEDNIIPAVARRVVGSSMLTSGDDTQVDIARKVREDPLLLIKERERAARAALLNNPVHRRKIAELLKKEQSKKKEAPKKSKNNDLDNKLAEKLNSLGGENGVDLAALLASDSSSSSDSSSEDEKSKTKKKKKKDKKVKKKKKSRKRSASPEHTKASKKSSSTKPRKHKSDDGSEEVPIKHTRYYDFHSAENLRTCEHSPSTKNQNRESSRDHRSGQEIGKSRRDQESHSDSDDAQRRSSEYMHTRNYDQGSERSRLNDSKVRRRGSQERNRYKGNKHRHRDLSEVDHKRKSPVERRGRSPDNKESRESPVRRKGRFPGSRRDDNRKERKSDLSEAERAERVRAMAAAGLAREQERAERVAAGRQATPEPRPRPSAAVASRALPESLSARIHSNRHYIQRDKQHMNEHFARR